MLTRGGRPQLRHLSDVHSSSSHCDEEGGSIRLSQTHKLLGQGVKCELK